MASEHVATDLRMPAVRLSGGAEQVSGLLRDVPLPAVTSRRFAIMSYGATQATMGPSQMIAQAPSATDPVSEPTVPSPRGTASQRLSEVLAALSVVLDSAERRPEGYAVRTAYIAARIGGELALPEERRAALLYSGLLSDVGTIGPASDPVADAARARRSGLSRYRRDVTPAHLSRPNRA